MEGFFYSDWIDNQYGLLPQKGAESFNNVVYLTELLVGLKLSGKLTDRDLWLYMHHLGVTADSNGLYKPKNSHDNVSMKLFGSMILDTPDYKHMSYFEALKAANFHPRDVLLYTLAIGPKALKIAIKPFLWIAGIMIILTALSQGKVRPKDYWKLWFKSKKLIEETKTKDGWIRKYLLSDNSEYTVRLHQNDGKILSFFRLLALQDKSLTLKITARLYEFIMIKKYGSNYMKEAYYRYFPEPYHPIIETWSNFEARL